MSVPRLVVAGGSWGGLHAACLLLAAMPVPLPAPVLLVLHRGPRSDGAALRSVLAATGHDLCEAEDKSPLSARRVLLAPPGYHALVDRGEICLSTEAPVNSCRPSIDVAFESAADDYGPGLVAVLLSGLGRDGAGGLRRVKGRGGRALVQAPESAERADMPCAGIATGCADEVATAEELGRRLAALLEIEPVAAKRVG